MVTDDKEIAHGQLSIDNKHGATKRDRKINRWETDR